MKINDKLYCIKNKTVEGKHKPKIAFKKGKMYDISYVISDVVYVHSDEIGHDFYFEDRNDVDAYFRLKEYFATKEEYRKIKLQLLNEIDIKS